MTAENRVEVTLLTGEVAKVAPAVAEDLEKRKAAVKKAEAKAVQARYSTYEREKAVRAARRQLDAEEAQEKAEASGIAPVRDRLMGVDEFMDAAPPPALVRDVLDGGGLSMLIGQRGSYKTAVALDMALSIACGIPWGTCRTERGRVLYLVGEGGGRAFGIRLEAWLSHHGMSREAIRPWFTGLNGAAPFMSSAWDELVEAAREYGPALVIVDTLARHQIGLDENSNSDASEAVRKADHLRAQTGAAVMVLHHPPKAGGGARGAGAWEGGADSVFLLEADEPAPGQVLMTTTKQKHRPETGQWTFRIEQVPVRHNGIWPTSMVPVHLPTDPYEVDKAAQAAKDAKAAALQAEVLEFIRGREAADMAPNMTAFRDHFQETKRREAALDALQELRRRGEVELVPGVGRSKVLHVITEAKVVPFVAAVGGADA